MRISSLLAAAATFVSYNAAFAADLPMTKAEPVEYVKVCSEFGDGFYYIPGSDTCLSINGYVRADYWYFDPDSRADDGFRFYTKGLVAFDARTATEYGTLRSYLALQYTHGDPGTDNTVTADKAFIQFGGWTAGYATSFYNFYDAEAGNTLHGTYFSSSVTTHLLAYTAVFDGGFTASLSIEDNYYRREGIFSPDEIALPALSDVDDPYAIYGGQRAPDIVASLRWTQDWGSAQIMAAAHQNRSDISGTAFEFASGILGAPVDHDSEWGWAVGAGFIVNLPSGFFFALEGNYARGAASYAGLFDGTGNDVVDASVGSQVAAAFVGSPFYTGDLELSEAWSVTADLGYNFTPSLVGHIVASYANYDSPGKAYAPIFVNFGLPAAELPGLADFDTWAVTANLTYTIVKGLTIAGEVSYEHRDYDELLHPLAQPSLTAPFDGDYSTWAGGVRLKRSF